MAPLRNSSRYIYPLSIVLVVFGLGGCSLLLGESFVGISMHNPTTGAKKYCKGHVGRGDPSSVEVDTMTACANWYETKGFVRDN